MPILPVIKMGNPLLREVCTDVNLTKVNTPHFQSNLDNLIETMRSEDGAGIAAPQVGIKERFFSMEVDNNPRYPDKESFPLRIAINPTVTPLDDEMVDSWEGCLSIPDIRGRLRRHKQIRLEAYNRQGEQYSIELDGFAAVVCQHEMDHLNGILYIDRMEDMKTLSFYEEYKAYWM